MPALHEHGIQIYALHITVSSTVVDYISFSSTLCIISSDTHHVHCLQIYTLYIAFRSTPHILPSDLYCISLGSTLCILASDLHL
jgi:hypothetical protein